MTHHEPTSRLSRDVPDGLALDADQLGRAALSLARTMIGATAGVALVIGIALLVWPGKSLVVVGALAGVFFVMTGVMRTAVGAFARGLPTGFRVLNIILGLVLLLGGIVSLKNLTVATAVLTIVVVVMIGIGWIIDGIATLAETGRTRGSAWGYLRGALSVLAGVVVLVVPTWSAVALVIVVGATLVALGLAGLVQAFALGKDLPAGAAARDA
ncbi:DUF308 domain-containing protein [Demequina muriae]|uniref:DUF308 domain-containing protein n=1 Tax=Demequina muriae TaxID=3051664 RepID=A0ABT8GFQ6_9MICO|nr:DUF308 domain-containing protein [Demequina sp. EGI L300058]MDN4480094.1 DUF308 domain-containing protein [Demequina sp. EGI L300058]